MPHLERLRTIVREIASDGETEALRQAARLALEEPEFAALPALGLLIGGSRFADELTAAMFAAWNLGD